MVFPSRFISILTLLLYDEFIKLIFASEFSTPDSSPVDRNLKFVPASDPNIKYIGRFQSAAGDNGIIEKQFSWSDSRIRVAVKNCRKIIVSLSSLNSYGDRFLVTTKKEKHNIRPNFDEIKLEEEDFLLLKDNGSYDDDIETVTNKTTIFVPQCAYCRRNYTIYESEPDDDNQNSAEDVVTTITLHKITTSESQNILKGSYATLSGFYVSENCEMQPLPEPKPATFRLHFIGDSDTAGWCSQGSPWRFWNDSPSYYEDSSITWAAQLASKLNSNHYSLADSDSEPEYHSTAISGIGISSALIQGKTITDWMQNTLTYLDIALASYFQKGRNSRRLRSCLDARFPK